MHLAELVLQHSLGTLQRAGLGMSGQMGRSFRHFLTDDMQGPPWAYAEWYE